MDIDSVDFSLFPQTPGVYIFKGGRGNVLYIGRATNLRSRIRSYFSKDLLEKRGNIIVGAREQTKKIDVTETDTVLEALLLEAALIKKHIPLYNSKEKSNTSFCYVVITNEEYPKVKIVRGSELESIIHPQEIKYQFGPFPSSGLLREAMHLVRKIFPYREKCRVGESGKHTRACFNAQLGLCPGVCIGIVSKKEYARNIRNIVLFLNGRKKDLVKKLIKEMHSAAKKEEFEKAGDIKKTLFALQYINDVHLIKKETRYRVMEDVVRVEAYDVSHTAGSDSVGVMCVIVNGELSPQEYRKFILCKTKPGDDVGGLAEIVTRRIHHDEWTFPDCIVVDGGKNQYNRVREVLDRYDLSIPVVGVVKDDTHTPKGFVGSEEYIKKYASDILRVNEESHRYAISWHRKRRDTIKRK